MDDLRVSAATSGGADSSEEVEKFSRVAGYCGDSRFCSRRRDYEKSREQKILKCFGFGSQLLLRREDAGKGDDRTFSSPDMLPKLAEDS